MKFGRIKIGDVFNYNGYQFEKETDSTACNSKFGQITFFPSENVELVSEIVGDDLTFFQKLKGLFWSKT